MKNKVQLDLTNYPDIEILESVYKGITEFDNGSTCSEWYAYGSKSGYHTSASGKTKKEALRFLDLHLSYIS